MADLTRFDFHAKKFYFSEDVQIMSAEEVGQYLLLLVSAWLGGKDASLPDNAALLARVARVSEVSQAVLTKFPIVETEYGPRRRNETLYEEWQAATSRSTSASQNGQVGGRVRSEAKVEAARSNGSKGGRPSLIIPSGTQAGASVIPSETQSQSNPIQSNPIQTNSDQSASERSLSQEAPSKPLGGDWKNIAIRHRNAFSKKASVSFKGKYAEACATYGEEVVLECFDAWAPGAKDWVKNNNVDQPLFSFFKKLPEEATDAVEINKAVEEESTKVATAQATEERNIQASIARQIAEHQKDLDSRVELGESLEEFLGAK